LDQHVSIQQLVDEFLAEFWLTAGTIGFAPIGLGLFETSVALPTPTEMNPDPTLFLGNGLPDETIPHASWRRSEILAAAEPDGWLARWIGQAWLALTYARWEDYYRPKIAKLAGIGVAGVRSDVMGDIRHLRNDVSHHRGIATGGHAGRCVVLKRFNAGEAIALTSDDILLLRSKFDVRLG